MIRKAYLQNFFLSHQQPNNDHDAAAFYLYFHHCDCDAGGTMKYNGLAPYVGISKSRMATFINGNVAP